MPNINAQNTEIGKRKLTSKEIESINTAVIYGFE